MKHCQRLDKDLAVVLDGRRSGNEEADMNTHQETCPDCRRARAEVERILAGAAEEREDLRRVMAEVDWDALSERIADAAWASKPGPAALPAASRSLWRAMFAPPWKGVVAAVLGGIVIGAAATYFILHPPAGRRPGLSNAAASADFVDRAELRLARQETIDYLDKSQVVILDLLEKATSPGEALSAGRASDAARDLLTKKRFITPGLDRFQMAKARDICNQIELLFLELSQLSDEISAEEASRIKAFVEQRQLLLKIRLLRQELAKNGV
jgi:hypothetical protein